MTESHSPVTHEVVGSSPVVPASDPQTASQDWPEKVGVRKPNFFIVGAPRCGTTSLWGYLQGHPEIYMPAQKELYFFDADLWGSEAWAPSLEQYLGFFSAAGGQKRIGEATPSYLRSKLAPKAIKTFSPGAQIIIMLRNPVDVMYSLHSQGLRYNTEPITDFETALEADGRRRGRELLGYRESTNFPQQVQRYFDRFGRENVHTIIYDDLKKNSAAVCQNTLRFLGVRLDFASEFPLMNSNKQARNARLQAMLLQPRALREISRALVPHKVRARIRRSLSNANRVVRPRPPMDTELRRRLQKEFEPKVERLSRLLGRDLSGWCKESNGESARQDDREQQGTAPS
ncbi:MAG: sulfotransferase family protein [Terriglobia bacterium]